MGVSKREVVMFGCRLTYKEYDARNKDDGFDIYKLKFDPKKDEGIRILADGMNGKYAIVGFPIIYSVDSRWANEGIPLTPIESEDEFARKLMIRRFVYEHFGIDRGIKYWILSHYY